MDSDWCLWENRLTKSPERFLHELLMIHMNIKISDNIKISKYNIS